MNDTVKHFLIGGVIFIIGASLSDFARMTSLGDIIAGAGIVYAILSVIVLNINKPIAVAEKVINEREKDKAHEDLLKYKKLLDEGVLNQEEFDVKSKQLKKKIL